jgi:vancomycin resistance protein YoaR
VPVGGLDRPEAAARVRAALPSVRAGAVTVVLGEERVTIPYSAVGRDYNVDQVLAQAFAVGRTGDPVGALQEQLSTLLYGREFAVGVEYEQATLERRLRLAAATFRQGGVNARVLRASDGSGFTIVPSQDGRVVSAEPLIAAMGSRLGTLDPAPITLQAAPRAIQRPVTTEMAQAAVARAEAIASTPLEFKGIDKTWTIEPAQIRRWISFGTTDDEPYGVRFKPQGVEAFVASLAEPIDLAPREPTLIREGTTVVGYTRGRAGRTLDVDATIAAANAALQARFEGGGQPEPVQLAIAVVKPEMSDEQAAARVERAPSQLRLLGRWTTNYVPSEKNFFGVNISLPTSRLNNTVVQPGEWFNFIAHVGPLSRANGYGPGGFIRNGRTDPTGATAGGICSCSTTIFNAAVRAGLEIGERHEHSYYITRYPLGLDATVSTSNGQVVQNMTFRNDTDSPITIRSYNSYGATTFEIWGRPTGRRVVFSNPVVTNVQRAGDVIEHTSALPTGQAKRIEYPADGKHVVVTRTVYDASGNVLHRDTFVSNYRKVDGVTLVGR